jgi:F-type H+-transporting ATPase subunit a
MELLPDKIAELVHELSVLPFDNMHAEAPVESPWVLTNYVVWGLIALFLVIAMFVAVANKEKRQMAIAEKTGDVTALAPSGRMVGMFEAGVDFIRSLAVDVIGQKDGPKYVPLLGSFFFLLITSNMLGLIPGGKSIGGTIGGTVALALISWLVFVWVGFTKNGFLGYMKSLIPSGVREMPLAGRIGLGGFIFLLEFVSTFIVRPLTLAVRLFANLYAGHIILGVFSAFVLLFMQRITVGGTVVGVVSLAFLIIMYAFEIFVAFIQAYVFTILTAVYIQSSVHASEH